MTVLLLPRLDAVEAERFVGLHPREPLKNLSLSAGGGLPAKVSFGASGGHRISIESLRNLQANVIEIASKSGYPEKGSINDRSKFDEGASIFLGSHAELSTGEALRDDTWAFLTTMLLPEVVYWRFGLSVERFLGGVRNTLQRLWIRGALFDRGEHSQNRWNLLGQLTEDAMVQITERPAISGDKVLALATAEAWARASEKYPKGSMEDIMRKATIGIRLRNELIMLSHLEPGALAAALDNEFSRAEKTVRS